MFFEYMKKGSHPPVGKDFELPVKFGLESCLGFFDAFLALLLIGLNEALLPPLEFDHLFLFP